MEADLASKAICWRENLGGEALFLGMGKRHIISLSLSALFLAIFTLLAVRSIGALGHRTVEVNRALLLAGSKIVQHHLAYGGLGLPELANALADQEGLGNEHRVLASALNQIEGASSVPPRVQTRIDDQLAKLGERIGQFQAAYTDIHAATFVNDVGVVLLTTSDRFRVGQRLTPDRAEQEEQAAAQQDQALAADTGDGDGTAEPGADTATPQEEQAAKRAAQPSMISRALWEEVAIGGIAAGDGAIYYEGASPIYARNRVCGAVIIERKLEALPSAPGTEVFLTLDGKVILGTPPAGFTESPGKEDDAPARLVQRDLHASVVGIPFPVGPLAPDAELVGVWATRVAVYGLEGAAAYITADLAPEFVELASQQAAIVLIAFALFLIHAAILFFFGRDIQVGIGRMADFLGRMHQGKGNQKALSQHLLPAELHRLARLINKTLENRPQNNLSPLPKAPSVDEVIHAQSVAPPPDVSDFDFEGIASAGNIDLNAEAERPKAPFEAPDAEGFGAFELPDDDGVFAAEAEESPQRSASERPELPSPHAAVDSLSSREPTENDPGVAGATSIESSVAALDADDLVLEDEGEIEMTLESPTPSQQATGSDGDEPMRMSSTLLAELNAIAGSKGAIKAPPGAGAGSSATGMDSIAAAAAAASAEATAAPNDDKASHFQEIFQQFMDTRKRCGETGALSFDKFAARLETSRAAVIAKHSCDEVRFQVYVKGGKAALKATPAG